IPFGKRIIGRKMPTTLGSGIAAEDFTGTTPTSACGNASRTAARTRRIPLSQRMTIHRAPTAQIAQTPQIAIDAQSMEWAATRDGVVLEKRAREKGSLTCSIANENEGTIGTAAR